jgi:hypothetical protein
VMTFEFIPDSDRIPLVPASIFQKSDVYDGLRLRTSPLP